MEIPLAGMENAAILMVGIRLSPSGRESKRVQRERRALQVRPWKIPWETMLVARERPKAKVFSQQRSAFSLSSYATISIEAALPGPFHYSHENLLWSLMSPDSNTGEYSHTSLLHALFNA